MCLKRFARGTTFTDLRKSINAVNDCPVYLLAYGVGRATCFSFKGELLLKVTQMGFVYVKFWDWQTLLFVLFVLEWTIPVCTVVGNSKKRKLKREKGKEKERKKEYRRGGSKNKRVESVKQLTWQWAKSNAHSISKLIIIVKFMSVQVQSSSSTNICRHIQVYGSRLLVRPIIQLSLSSYCSIELDLLSVCQHMYRQYLFHEPCQCRPYQVITVNILKSKLYVSAQFCKTSLCFPNHGPCFQKYLPN